MLALRSQGYYTFAHVHGEEPHQPAAAVELCKQVVCGGASYIPRSLFSWERLHSRPSSNEKARRALDMADASVDLLEDRASDPSTVALRAEGRCVPSLAPWSVVTGVVVVVVWWWTLSCAWWWLTLTLVGAVLCEVMSVPARVRG